MSKASVNYLSYFFSTRIMSRSLSPWSCFETSMSHFPSISHRPFLIELHFPFIHFPRDLPFFHESINAFNQEGLARTTKRTIRWSGGGSVKTRISKHIFWNCNTKREKIRLHLKPKVQATDFTFVLTEVDEIIVNTTLLVVFMYLSIRFY